VIQTRYPQTVTCPGLETLITVIESSDQPSAISDFNPQGARFSMRSGVSRAAACAHGRPPLPRHGGTAGSVRDARRSKRRARVTSDPRRPRTARLATDGRMRTHKFRGHTVPGTPYLTRWQWISADESTGVRPSLDRQHSLV